MDNTIKIDDLKSVTLDCKPKNRIGCFTVKNIPGIDSKILKKQKKIKFLNFTNLRIKTNR